MEAGEEGELAAGPRTRPALYLHATGGRSMGYLRALDLEFARDDLALFANPWDPFAPDLALQIDDEHAAKRGVGVIRRSGEEGGKVTVRYGAASFRPLRQLAGRGAGFKEFPSLNEAALYAYGAAAMSVKAALGTLQADVITALLYAPGSAQPPLRAATYVPLSDAPAVPLSLTARSTRNVKRTDAGAGTSSAGYSELLDSGRRFSDAQATGFLLHVIGRGFRAGFLPALLPAGLPPALVLNGVAALDAAKAWYASKAEGDHCPASLRAVMEDFRSNLAAILYQLAFLRGLGGDTKMYGRAWCTTWLERQYARLRGGTGAALGASNTASMGTAQALRSLGTRALGDINTPQAMRGMAVSLKVEGGGKLGTQTMACVEVTEDAAGVAREAPAPFLSITYARPRAPLGTFTSHNEAVLAGGVGEGAHDRLMAGQLFKNAARMALLFERLTFGGDAGLSWALGAGPVGAAVLGARAGSDQARGAARTLCVRGTLSTLVEQPSYLLASIGLALELALVRAGVLGPLAAAQLANPLAALYSRRWVVATRAARAAIRPLCAVALGVVASDDDAGHLAHFWARAGVRAAYAEFEGNTARRLINLGRTRTEGSGGFRAGLQAGS